MSVPGTDLQGWRWLRGRAGRLEYWVWITVIVAWAALFVVANDELPQRVLATVLWLQLIRRLHDFGRTGWWIAAFPFVEIVRTVLADRFGEAAWPVLLVTSMMLGGFILIGAIPGSSGGNRFGSPPQRGDPTKRRPIHA